MEIILLVLIIITFCLIIINCIIDLMASIRFYKYITKERKEYGKK